MGTRNSFGTARHSLISDSKREKPKVRLVFSHLPPEKPTWPNIGYDYEGRKKELTAKLQKALPGIDFSPVMVQSAQDAEELLQSDRNTDGYVVYLVGIWTGAAHKIAASGRPTILVDDLYAGSSEFLIEYARALREGHRVAGVSSSRFEDVVEAVGCFECIKKLRSCTILDVTDSEGFWGDPITKYSEDYRNLQMESKDFLFLKFPYHWQRK